MPSDAIKRPNQLIGETNMKNQIETPEDYGPSIQPSIILRFLLKRCHEMIEDNPRKFPAVLQALGAAGLAHDEQLTKTYRENCFSSSRSTEEIIRRSMDIFQLALDQNPDECCIQQSKTEGDDSEPDAKFCRHILITTLNEATKMADEAEFIEIFHILGWIGLQRDAPLLAEFEAICESRKDDPVGVIHRGREIMKQALFRRPNYQ
jgi:hypothetical protein